MMIRKLFKAFQAHPPSPYKLPPATEASVNPVSTEPASLKQPIRPSSGYVGFSASDWEKSVGGGSSVASDLMHPDRTGLDVASAADLMLANRSLIDQALHSFTQTHYIEGFDNEVLELIGRVAHWMGPMPASKSYHHIGRGGLFTHSLGVALSALHMSASKNVVLASSPRERDADLLAWQLICFVAGLLHDIGKVHTIGVVKAFSLHVEAGQGGQFRSSSAPVYDIRWKPTVEGFEGWANIHRVQSYFIDFDHQEKLPHREFTTRYVMTLVPRAILSFIYSANPMIAQQFEDFIRNPESGARTPIFQVVQDADHMNVAQSLDPRRRPGSIEMTGLVLRRFAEFASESTWNMPTSAFIYAHVQKETPGGLKFFGIPFFVATETTLKNFIEYIKSRPMLGVSFGERITELVFNALETSNIMARTIDGLLPEQIADETLQDYIPASKAELLFKASNVESVLKPINGTYEDLLISLPVVPIQCTVPSQAPLNAPVLAFYGTPTSSDVAVVPAAISGKSLVPSDTAATNDAVYMENWSHIVNAPSPTEITQYKKPSKAPNGNRHTDRLKDMINKPAKGENFVMDLGDAPEANPNKIKLSDLLSGPNDDPNMAPEQKHSPSAPSPATPATPAAPPGADAKPADPAQTPQDPPWLAFAKKVLSEGEALQPLDFWAVVHIYFSENPISQSDVLKPYSLAGIHGFIGEFSAKPRDIFFGAFKSYGLNMQRCREIWPNEQLKHNSLSFQGVFKAIASDSVHNRGTGQMNLQFLPPGCEIIEDFHLEAKG